MKQSSSLLARTLLASACLLGTSSVWAAAHGMPGPSASPDAIYQQDRAACMASDSQHERTSCLREAAAARALAKARKPMTGESPEVRMQNAMKRCTNLPAESKATCERMVRGEGTASGSVEGGGVIRELVTPVPATR